MESTILDTPTRTRTRSAILQAAIAVLSQDPAGSLGEIADSAGVARSTLHRYFADRTALIDALRAYAEEQIDAATKRARLGDGTGAEALMRLCHEYFDHWATIMWSYTESLKDDRASGDCDDQMDPDFTALIERGHADGTIDPALPNAWLQQVLWAVLYSGREYMQQGHARHEAATLALDSLRRLTMPGQDNTGAV